MVIQLKVAANSARMTASRAVIPLPRMMSSIMPMPISVVPATNPKNSQRRSRTSGRGMLPVRRISGCGALLDTIRIPNIAPSFGQPPAVQLEIEPRVGRSVAGWRQPKRGAPAPAARQWLDDQVEDPTGRGVKHRFDLLGTLQRRHFPTAEVDDESALAARGSIALTREGIPADASAFDLSQSLGFEPAVEGDQAVAIMPFIASQERLVGYPVRGDVVVEFGVRGNGQQFDTAAAPIPSPKATHSLGRR